MYEPNRFVAIDGDQVGKKLEEAVLRNDILAVIHLSESIRDCFILLGRKLEGFGMVVHINAGDMVLAQGMITSKDLLSLELGKGPIALSCGLGKTLRLAHLALRVAKAHGGNRIVEAIGDLGGDLEFQDIRLG